jgi:hypothetical protein
VTRAPLGDTNSARRLDETVSSWAKQWHASALLGVEHQPSPDDRGHFHWLIRLKGDEKDVITLWLSLRQRTVHVETEVTPAPEENRETLYRYLLVKNAEIRELHLAIGPEDGIYLQTQIPIGEVTVERLDEVVGATLTYVEEIYPTAMTMGLSSLYRRRRTS